MRPTNTTPDRRSFEAANAQLAAEGSSVRYKADFISASVLPPRSDPPRWSHWHLFLIDGDALAHADDPSDTARQIGRYIDGIRRAVHPRSDRSHL